MKGVCQAKNLVKNLWFFFAKSPAYRDREPLEDGSYPLHRADRVACTDSSSGRRLLVRGEFRNLTDKKHFPELEGAFRFKPFDMPVSIG